MSNRRRSLGFPEMMVVEKWLELDENAVWPPEAAIKRNSLKNTEMPVLDNYEGSAEDDFWEKFPKRELPKEATTRVNVEKFRNHVDDVRSKMSRTEIRRAKEC